MCVSCEFTFADSNTWRQAVEDSVNHITAVSYFSVFSSGRPVSLSPEGRGQSLSVCDTVFPHRVQVRFPLPECVHVLVTAPDERRVCFFFLPTPVWLGWCVNVSIEHAVAALPIVAPCKLLHMSALPKVFFHSMSCSSEMIFIPLGILDKFSWSPLTKHILGRVSPNLTWDCSIFFIKTSIKLQILAWFRIAYMLAGYPWAQHSEVHVA